MFMLTTQEILGMLLSLKNHKNMRNKPENKNYLLFSSVFKINFNDPKSNFFFSVRLWSVLCGHSVFHPRHNGQ